MCSRICLLCVSVCLIVGVYTGLRSFAVCFWCFASVVCMYVRVGGKYMWILMLTLHIRVVIVVSFNWYVWFLVLL